MIIAKVDKSRRLEQVDVASPLVAPPRLYTLANKVTRLVSLAGGVIRSQKRLKAIWTHLCATDVDELISTTAWDGLFFCGWSSELAQAIDWACTVLGDVRRYLWTRDTDPLHTIYTTPPPPGEVPEAEQRLQAEVLAWNLTHWNYPVHWLLALDTYTACAGDAETQEAMATFVNATDTQACDQVQGIMREVEEGSKIRIRPLKLQLMPWEADQEIVLVFPFVIDRGLWQQILGFYRDEHYNRRECLEVTATDDFVAEIRVDPDRVRETYQYLEPQRAATDLDQLLDSARQGYETLVRWSCARSLGDVARDDNLTDASELTQPLRRQEEWLLSEAVSTDVRKQVCRKVTVYAHALSEATALVRDRWENILHCIKALAAASKEYPVLMSRDKEHRGEDSYSAIRISVSEEFLNRVTQLHRQPQEGTAVHFYHLFQPFEVAQIVRAQKQDRLLHGTAGGGAMLAYDLL